MKSKRNNVQTNGLGYDLPLSPISVAIRSSIVGLGLAHSAHAATITVTSNLDNNGGGCTLREAIVSANTSTNQANGCTLGGSSGTDTITFSNTLIGLNTIVLSGSHLTLVDKDLEINAAQLPNGITIDGYTQSGILAVTDSSISIDNLTLTRGYTRDDGGAISATLSTIHIRNSTLSGNYAGDDGAGISSNFSTIVLTNAIVSDNYSLSGGGGIDLESGSTASIYDSKIVRNSAVSGGGIKIDGGSLTIKESDVSSNTSMGGGGGISALYAEIELHRVSLNANFAGATGGGLRFSGRRADLYGVSVIGNSALAGGGIYSDGGLTINDSYLSNNLASTSGGAIQSRFGSASLSKTTLFNNSAQIGGGLYVDTTAVNVINSTISGNFAESVGGAIYAYDYSEIEVNQSTIANNEAALAGGVYARYGSINLTNSIVAGSTKISDGLPSNDCLQGTGGTISIEFTLIEDGTCGAITFGDPGLLPLANNGGSTKTHALKANSIARNSGLAANCPSQDQRSQVRDVSDGFCDVGAYEFIDENFYVIPLSNGKTVVIPL